MKRFIETTDWREPWHRKLSSQAKHLRRYLWDNCDCAGVITPDYEAITFHVGQTIEEKHLAELGDWVEHLPNGRLLIPSFVHFQSGELSPNCRAHESILKAIASHNLVRSGKLYHHSSDSLSSQPPLSPDRGQLQLKVQDKYKVQLKDYPESLRSDAFHSAWTEWQSYRRDIRHKLTPSTITRQLNLLAAVGESRAIATINLSIERGWQGLFPEKASAHRNGTTTTPKPILKVRDE